MLDFKVCSEIRKLFNISQRIQEQKSLKTTVRGTKNLSM